MKNRATGIARVIATGHYSMQGPWSVPTATRRRSDKRLLARILTPVALGIADSSLQLALPLASLMLVLITELLNSAIESLVG